MLEFCRRYGAVCLVPPAAFVLAVMITRQVYRVWPPARETVNAQQVESWKELLSAALEAFKSDDRAGALAKLIEAESKTPADAEAYRSLSEAFRTLDESSRALNCMEKSLVLAQSETKASMESFVGLGHGYLRDGRIEDAQRILDEYIFTSWPESAEGHYLQATLLLERAGQEEQALKHLGKALEGLPESNQIRHQYGICLSRLGRLEQAEEAFSEIVAKQPKYASAYYELGGVLQRQGKKHEAEEALKRFEEIEAKLRRQEILKTHFALKRETPEHMLELAQLHSDLDNHEMARIVLQKYIVSRADDPQGHRLLAAAYEALDRPELAAAESRIADALQEAANFRSQSSDSRSSPVPASEESRSP
jgi:tetratricopeptide (TPR) repeat protein